MQIGCLGDIIFQVNNRVVETLNNMSLSGSARYTEHARIGLPSITEFNGTDAEKFSFEMTLSAHLGSNVMSTINRIRHHKDRGTTLPLVVGRTSYGRFRWTIQSYSVTGISDMSQLAVVKIDLLEYLRT